MKWGLKGQQTRSRKQRAGFFEKINKIDETLARFTKKKKKDDSNSGTKET